MGSNKPLDPIVIFLHLPKSAGSTLVGILERQYGKEKVLHLYDSLTGEEVADLPEERRKVLLALVGHFYFGAHPFLSRPATYITLLRDPVTRIISHYRYVQREPDHYLYSAARELRLSEYVIHCGKAEPNNDQVRLLAGRDHAREDGTWSEAMLPAAKKHLEERFSAVGLVEEFDRSLILMKRVFGWRIPFYVKQNVSRTPKGDGSVDQEAIRAIQAYNQLDTDLYRFARLLLAEQVRSYGKQLERELRLFKSLNALFARMNAMTKQSAGHR